MNTKEKLTVHNQGQRTEIDSRVLTKLLPNNI